MKARIVFIGIICMLAGLVIAQSTQPEMPKGLQDAKERYDKDIERAEQVFQKAKAKALSAYYTQLDRAVKQEKDPEVAKAISDERAIIREEIDNIENSKPATAKGLVGLKLMNSVDSTFYIKKDGTFMHKKKSQTEFEKWGTWKPIERGIFVKWDEKANYDETPLIVENGKVYQIYKNKSYVLTPTK